MPVPEHCYRKSSGKEAHPLGLFALRHYGSGAGELAITDIGLFGADAIMLEPQPLADLL